MNVVGTAANLYVRDARDHLWHANRDKQMVGTGVALVKNVRAAHVRTQGEGRTDEGGEDRKKAPGHRNRGVISSLGASSRPSRCRRESSTPRPQAPAPWLCKTRRRSAPWEQIHCAPMVMCLAQGKGSCGRRRPSCLRQGTSENSQTATARQGSSRKMPRPALPPAPTGPSFRCAAGPNRIPRPKRSARAENRAEPNG